MSAIQLPLTLKVEQVDEKTGARSEIGQLEYGERGYLKLLAASPDRQAYLDDLVQTVNDRTTLRIKVPPPGGAEPFSIYAQDVTRDDPELLDVLQTFLRQRYGLFVTPTGADVPPGKKLPSETSAKAATAPQPPSQPASAASTTAEPPKPDPVQVLAQAIASANPTAVKESLLTLKVDPRATDEILKAWEVLASPARHADRLASMVQLTKTLTSLAAPKEVKNHLWKLQKDLTRYT